MRTKQTLMLIFLVISLIPTSILGIYTTNLIKLHLQETTSHEIEVDVATVSKDIQSFFSSIEKDLLFLSKSDSLINLLDAQDTENENSITEYKLILGNLFQGFSETYGIYDQIRFIDDTGQEIVRVDMDDSSPRILGEDELQNKAQRYYFTETIQLANDEVYVSPLDLNVEQGEVETPYKPMIRFSTPVYDKYGAKRGIVILNVFATPILNKVKETSLTGVTFLVDQNGFYLEHPLDSKEWGNDLDTDENLVNDYPQVGPLVLTEKMKVTETAQDHITSYFISYNKQNPETQLIIVNIIPKSEIIAQYYQAITVFSVILLLSCLSSIIMGSLLSKRLTDPLMLLTEGAKKMTAGDLNVQIPITSNDELGELTEAFNSTTKALQLSYNSLEKKVELRTRKLDEANKELQKYLDVIEEQNTKLTELDDMKTSFIVTATHELRTPVTSILGYVDFMIQDKSLNLSDDAKNDLKIVLRNATRLADLTNDLLDVQRIQTGRLEIHPKEFDLSELVKQVSEELTPLLQEKNHIISLDIPENLMITGDEIRLSQLLINLLRNADKFTPEAGEISISIETLGDRLQIRIKDTGIGLTPRDIDKLFKPFPGINHGLNVTSSGLGLSISKGIVDLHEGKIWAESGGKGKGSTFIVELPL